MLTFITYALNPIGLCYILLANTLTCYAQCWLGNHCLWYHCNPTQCRSKQNGLLCSYSDHRSLTDLYQVRIIFFLPNIMQPYCLYMAGPPHPLNAITSLQLTSVIFHITMYYSIQLRSWVSIHGYVGAGKCGCGYNHCN